MLDIADPLAAYCLDSAIAELGNTISSELEEAALDSKAKRSGKRAQGKQMLVLKRMLEDTQDKPKFRDPGKEVKGD